MRRLFETVHGKARKGALLNQGCNLHCRIELSQFILFYSFESRLTIAKHLWIITRSKWSCSCSHSENQAVHQVFTPSWVRPTIFWIQMAVQMYCLYYSLQFLALLVALEVTLVMLLTVDPLMLVCAGLSLKLQIWSSLLLVRDELRRRSSIRDFANRLC